MLQETVLLQMRSWLFLSISVNLFGDQPQPATSQHWVFVSLNLVAHVRDCLSRIFPFEDRTPEHYFWHFEMRTPVTCPGHRGRGHESNDINIVVQAYIIPFKYWYSFCSFLTNIQTFEPATWTKLIGHMLAIWVCIVGLRPKDKLRTCDSIQVEVLVSCKKGGVPGEVRTS